MSKAAKLKKKRVEDVLGGEEAWKNAPRSQSALLLNSSDYTIKYARPGMAVSSDDCWGFVL